MPDLPNLWPLTCCEAASQSRRLVVITPDIVQRTFFMSDFEIEQAVRNKNLRWFKAQAVELIAGAVIVLGVFNYMVG